MLLYNGKSKHFVSTNNSTNFYSSQLSLKDVYVAIELHPTCQISVIFHQFLGIFLIVKNISNDRQERRMQRNSNHFWPINRPKHTWCRMQLSESSILASDSELDIQRRRMSTNKDVERELFKSAVSLLHERLTALAR